jgi:hypothetical protein
MGRKILFVRRNDAEAETLAKNLSELGDSPTARSAAAASEGRETP